MKNAINNYKTTVAGFGMIIIASYALFEGKISPEIFSALCFGALGLIASKDGDKK
jgi:hypothetical protein